MIASIKRKYKVKVVNQYKKRSLERNQAQKIKISNADKLAEDGVRQWTSWKEKCVGLRKDFEDLKRDNGKLAADLKKSEKKVDDLNKKMSEAKEKIQDLEIRLDEFTPKKAPKKRKSDDDDNPNVLSSKKGRCFSPDVRLACYALLTRGVSVEAGPEVLKDILRILADITLTEVPSKSLFCQCALELEVLSRVQVGSYLDSNVDLNLAFDATTVDSPRIGHVNELHVNGLNSESCILDIMPVAGGSAAVYAKMITDSLTSIADVYSRAFSKDYETVIESINNSFSSTLSDRAPVNNCVVKLLEETLRRNILIFNCNAHPLEAMSRDVQSFLHRTGVRSCCFGVIGAGPNVISAVSKIRHDKKNGDAIGLKVYLADKDIPLKDFVRYVGNRLHVLFHSAGVVQMHADILLDFLKNASAVAGHLKSSLVKDLGNIDIMSQVWCLGMIGKFVTGPWMTFFYSDKVHVDTIPKIKECLENVNSLADHPENMLSSSRKFDVFGNDLSPDKDEVLAFLLQIGAPTDHALSLLGSLLKVCAEVIVRQMPRYMPDGDLYKLTEAQKQSAKSAPCHNMMSERALGMYDNFAKRAPNATAAFLNAKVKSKLNKTVDWLEKMDKSEREELIVFAQKEGVRQAAINKTKGLELHDALCQKYKRIRDNQDTKNRKVTAKSIDAYIEGDDTQEFDCGDDVRFLINRFRSDPTRGSLNNLLITHRWDIGEYYGRVSEHRRKKSGKKILDIDYWDMTQAEEDAESFEVTPGEFFTDMIIGDLSFYNASDSNSDSAST